MPDEKTARVTMEWPAGLKEKVRDKVGPRGLTPFTLEAVERLYDHRYNLHPDGGQVEPDKVDEPIAVTTPLPGDPVAEEDLVVSPPPAPEPEDEFDEHAPMFTQAKKKEPEPEPVAPPQDQAPAPSKPPNRPDLFEKLQRDGKDLGIDLKPASEVLKPYPKEGEAPAPASPPAKAPEGMEVCGFHPEMVVQPGHECYKCTLEKNGTDTTPTPPVQPAQPAVEAPACGDCGSVLVDGLCYECF